LGIYIVCYGPGVEKKAVQIQFSKFQPKNASHSVSPNEIYD